MEGRIFRRAPLAIPDHTQQAGAAISVCVLTYNHAHIIESTLESILNQTIGGFEVIVSDDCSTDETWKRVREFAVSHPNVHPIQTPRNVGMAANANFAVSHAQRPYVALLHHDDLCAPTLLQQWAGVLDRHPDALFVFNSYREDGAPEVIHSEPLPSECVDGRWLLRRYLLRRWGCLIHGTAMIRRQAWEALGGMREDFGLLADIDLWMRLTAKGNAGYVAEPLITVRHERPEDYPDIYREGRWSWPRLVLLYRIHATNRLAIWPRTSITNRASWWLFRLRVSTETSKWVAYAILKRRRDMLESCEQSTTPYDLWPLRLVRRLVLVMTKALPR